MRTLQLHSALARRRVALSQGGLTHRGAALLSLDFQDRGISSASPYRAPSRRRRSPSSVLLPGGVFSSNVSVANGSDAHTSGSFSLSTSAAKATILQKWNSFVASWKKEVAGWITMEKYGQVRRHQWSQPTGDFNFDHEKWALHKDPKRHIRHVILWGYSAATQRILFPDVALIMCTSTALTCHNLMSEVPWYMPPDPIVLPSVALGLLVTFRTNTATARYTEARQLWGEIVNTSRDITRVALQWLPESNEDVFGKAQAGKVCRFAKAFSITLKYHLTRDGGSPDTNLPSNDPDVEEKALLRLRDELIKYCFDPADPVQARELDLLLNSSHRPLTTIQQMSDAAHAGVLARTRDRPDRAIRDVMILEQHFVRLCNAMGACERIHRTPIPTAFTRHTSRFLFVWCHAMPFVLWPVVGSATPFASAFISWAMLGTEDIGVQVEEPFAVLPLFQYCQGIASSCDGLVKDAKANRITLSRDLESKHSARFHFGQDDSDSSMRMFQRQ